jgi:hypothetical protein
MRRFIAQTIGIGNPARVSPARLKPCPAKPEEARDGVSAAPILPLEKESGLLRGRRLFYLPTWGRVFAGFDLKQIHLRPVVL